MILYSISELIAEKIKGLPIVIPVFNNPSYLRMMIEQLLEKNFTEIIILDNNSAIEGMSDLLENLGQKLTVVKKNTNNGPMEFFQNKNIYSWLPRWFVITDPDIGFNKNLPDNFIEIMKNISDKFNVFRVGFALDIEMKGIENNIKQIKHTNKTIFEWESKFWINKIQDDDFEDSMYRAPLDTTFCLIDKNKYRGNYYGPSIRVADRFTAQHYGWYKKPPIPESELNFYLEKQKWSSTGNAIKNSRKI